MSSTRRRTTFLSVLALVSSLLPFTAAVPALAEDNPASTVFINEIHYDNTGTDAGEFVEVAGPAGTDLTGWAIVLYNGSGGAVYDTDALTGEIPDEGDGYGAVAIAYPANGVQNGSPDGIALVNNGTVVQFLSYEGSFIGVGGPADGLTSTDIGIDQDPAPEVGLSIQLQGTGLAYGHFAWTTGTASAGAVNGGQTFAEPPPPATPFVNEIHYDNDGVDEGEAVEVAGAAGTDLTGWSIVLYNGAGGTAYDAIDLGGEIEDEGSGYGALSFLRAGIQNGAPDGLALVDPQGEVLEFLSYEGSFTAVGGPADGMTSVDIGVSQTSTTPIGESIQRVGSGSVAGDFTWANAPRSFGCLNAGQTDIAGSCGPEPEPELTLISAIQGSGETSPLAGVEVTIEGVVVGDYEGPSPELRGFYVQEEDADHDADPATSEGMFVFNNDLNSVSLGDLVRVTGTVAEFQGQTQLGFPDSVDIVSSGNSVTPATVTMPFPSATYLERYEGMLVEFDHTLYVTEFFQLGRFGQIVVSSSDRLAQPTNVVAPGPEAVALQAANNLNRLIIDDGNNAQNPDPLVFGRGGNPLTAANTLRGGDTVTGAVGVMTYTWAGNAASGNAYRLRPINDLSDSGLVEGGGVPDFDAANPRPASRPEVGGSLSVASFNVLNYFLTLDDGGNDCGPVGFAQECRGAETALEFDRQRTKLLAALVELDVDLLALMELENTPGVEPVADLVAGLNEMAGAGTYGFVDTGVIGTDVIRTGLIYRTDAVAEVGDFAILDSSVDARFDDDLNRPTLAQSFEDLATGATLTVAVNHLKSKGCGDATGLDADQGDGQSCWNAARTAAAEAMVDWLAGHPTGVVDDDVLITGDLNSYAKEDPITVFADAGYVDLHSHFGGRSAYGYVFDGQWGYLDHALASASLFAQVTGAASYHINSDEPPVLDFNTNFKTANQVDLLFAPDEFRTSDHDPIVVGLELEVPLPVWSPTEIYNTGDRVTHNGKVYEALWWTRNQVPASPYGPWQEIAETADGMAIWTPSRIFDTGDRVAHEGKVYEALWWTRNQVPGNPHGPWQEMAETADGVAIWTPSRVFEAGDIVFHDANLYQARRWNRNVTPTGSGPWRLFG